MYSHRHAAGAVTGNRTRIAEMATPHSSFELSPQESAFFAVRTGEPVRRSDCALFVGHLRIERERELLIRELRATSPS